MKRLFAAIALLVAGYLVGHFQAPVRAQSEGSPVVSMIGSGQNATSVYWPALGKIYIYNQNGRCHSIEKISPRAGDPITFELCGKEDAPDAGK